MPMTKKRKLPVEAKKPEKREPRLEEHLISVPTYESGLYRHRRLELRLNKRESITLRSIFDGLNDSAERLPKNKPIRNQQDALRWVLNKIADEMGLEHSKR